MQWNISLTWVASSPMTPQSVSILTPASPKSAVPLEDSFQREYGRVIRRASPRRSRYTQQSSFPPSCTVLRSRFSTGSRSGSLSSFITLLALYPWRWQDYVVNKEVVKKASLPSTESILLQVQLRWAGHVSRVEDKHMPKAVFFSELQKRKRDHGAPRKRYKDQLKRQLAQVGICLLYTSPSPRDSGISRMPSSA